MKYVTVNDKDAGPCAFMPLWVRIQSFVSRGMQEDRVYRMSDGIKPKAGTGKISDL